jgi:hypothetical protein
MSDAGSAWYEYHGVVPSYRFHDDGRAHFLTPHSEPVPAANRGADIGACINERTPRASVHLLTFA